MPQLDVHFLIPLIAGLASALSALVILQRDPAHPGNRVAALLCAGCGYWAFCQVLWTHAADAGTALFFHRLAAFGWGFIGPLALHLILEVSGRPHPGVRRILPFLYGVSAVFVALQLFTSWMHSAAVPEPWGWGFVSGPAHVVYFAFTLSCALPAITMAMGSVRGAPSPAERSQLRLIACGMGAPLLIASVTGGVLPILGIQAPRMAAASFAVLGIIIAWSYHRYGFSALAPGSFSREILEILPDGVALISLAGRVLSANGGMARLLGASPDALGGTPIEAALGLRIADLQGEALERRNVECELTDASGERVPVALSTTLLRDKRELPLGIVLVVRDLREVVSLRNHLVTSGRLAAVGELAAGIAHEINNPMAFVRANLSQLQRGWEELAKRLAPAAADESLRELIAEGEELIQESLEGVERTAAIVQDIKGFAHAGSGSREQVDLNDLLHKVLRVARPQLRYRARVLTRFGEIPPVLGAPQELQQVFLNLLVNAGQAVEADGTVTVSTRAVDGHVEVEVEDDGCGIAPEDQGRIFDPFFTTKPVGEGTGLGLAISYQILRNHDADVSVDSEPGVGTTFTVRFPPLLSADT